MLYFLSMGCISKPDRPVLNASAVSWPDWDCSNVDVCSNKFFVFITPFVKFDGPTLDFLR